MNKLIFLALILGTLYANIEAESFLNNAKFRISAIVDYECESDESQKGGLETEVVYKNLGFGLGALVDFSQYELDSSTPLDVGREAFNWEGMVFARYHRWECNSFFDPYVEVGFGNAGYLEWDQEDVYNLKLSLFPSVGGGVNLVLDEGFFGGIRYSYRFDNNYIPGADIPEVDINRYQLTLQVGYQFGGRSFKEA